MARLAPMLLWLTACGTPWEERTEDGLRVLHLEDRSSLRGKLSLDIDVLDGESSMLVTVDPEDPYLGVFLSLKAPDGTVVFDLEDENDTTLLKTGASFPTNVVDLNWPILDEDLPLEAGRWKAVVGIVDDTDEGLVYTSKVDTTVDVVLAPDPRQSQLAATVVYMGASRDDADLHGAVDDAVEVWRDLYASVGIELVVDVQDSELDPVPPPGRGGDADFVALSASVPLSHVVVAIVPEFETAPGVYAVAGGIPGALVPTQRSAVVISAAASAGPDLAFSAQDVRLLGETMGHEVLHYLGLFHPVERQWDLWDALEDTPDCDNQFACVRDLGTNLMFPFPVCSGGTCPAQDQITGMQGATALRYAGVR